MTRIRARQDLRRLRGRVLAAALAAAASTACERGDEAVAAAAAAAAAPGIELWYGDELRFGALGHPQRWVNVLGHAAPGDALVELSYSLNGAPPRPLSFREDGRRLARTGDFNVELPRTALRPGANELALRARLADGRRLERRVRIRYDADAGPWPLPYAVRWRDVARIEDAAQVVDGRWRLTARGLRTAEPYYDRGFAVGDASWRDVEVTATVLVHATTPPQVPPNATGVTHVALALRWPGHDPDGLQPSVRWYPLGATAEFRLEGREPGGALDLCRWRIFDGDPSTYVESRRRREVARDRPYRLRHRVETLADGRVRYRVKAWPEGAAEPAGWDLERVEAGEDVDAGAALLLAHHADVTFVELAARPAR